MQTVYICLSSIILFKNTQKNVSFFLHKKFIDIYVLCVCMLCIFVVRDFLTFDIYQCITVIVNT